MEYQCPHCGGYFWIEETELNCRIIRHGVFKDDFQQIPQHLSKEACDQIVKDDLIFGCGRPVQIVGTTAVACDYI